MVRQLLKIERYVMLEVSPNDTFINNDGYILVIQEAISEDVYKGFVDLNIVCDINLQLPLFITKDELTKEWELLPEIVK